MTRRLKALFMLLVFGLVLPAAGAPHRFCTRTQSFIQQECCSQKKHCGNCPDSGNPIKPTCVSSAKVFPDGVNPDQISLPDIAGLPVTPFVLPEPKEIGRIVASLPLTKDRAPPGRLPLFLVQRSLLL